MLEIGKTKRSNGIIISRKYKIKSVEFSKNLAKILNISSSYTTNHFEKNVVLDSLSAFVVRKNYKMW